MEGHSSRHGSREGRGGDHGVADAPTAAVVDDPDAERRSLSLALRALAERSVAHPSTRAEVLDILLAELLDQIERAEDLPLRDDDDSLERNLHACPILHGLPDMDAGRGPRGPEVLAAVRRAFASGVVGDGVGGPWAHRGGRLAGWLT